MGVLLTGDGFGFRDGWRMVPNRHIHASMASILDKVIGGIRVVGHQNFIPTFLGVDKDEFRHPVRSLDT